MHNLDFQMHDIDFQEHVYADIKQFRPDLKLMGPPTQWKRPEERMEEYLDVYCGLSRFYNRVDMQKRQLDLKNAVRSEWDRAVHQILKMFGGASHLKAQAQSNVIIGIGSSPVKGHAGPFLAHLVNQLRARGYNNVFYVPEKKTSQKCGYCGNQTKDIKDTRHRVKKCSSCNLHHHRDIMAGHNIANAMEGYVREGKRPDYLAY